MAVLICSQKRIKDLEKERDKVADEIAMAKDQLKETGDLLSTLDESKQVLRTVTMEVLVQWFGN